MPAAPEEMLYRTPQPGSDEKSNRRSSLSSGLSGLLSPKPSLKHKPMVLLKPAGHVWAPGETLGKMCRDRACSSTVISQGFLGLPPLPSPSKDGKGRCFTGHWPSLCGLAGGEGLRLVRSCDEKSWCPCAQRPSNGQQRNTGWGILVTSSSPTVHPDSVPPRAVRGEGLVPCYLAIPSLLVLEGATAGHLGHRPCSRRSTRASCPGPRPDSF